MDPLTIGIAAVGVGMKIFGGMGASSAQSAAYAAQKDIASQEEGINAVKQQAMLVSANRSQLENFRNVQRVRAAGLNASVNQGAQFGSGIAGGQAQATDQGLFNSLGVNQAVQSGTQIFGYNNKISGDKMNIADDQSTAATDQGIANIGGALVGAAGTISNIYGAASSGVKNMNLGQNLFGGGSPTGYGNQ